MQHSAPLAVAESFPAIPEHESFEYLLKTLFPGRYGGVNYERMLACFEHRVSVRGVMNWRRGRRRIPQWAKECLARQSAHVAYHHEKIKPR